MVEDSRWPEWAGCSTLDPVPDRLIRSTKYAGEAANSPAWTVAGSPGRVAVPTLVQCVPSAES